LNIKPFLFYFLHVLKNKTLLASLSLLCKDYVLYNSRTFKRRVYYIKSLESFLIIFSIKSFIPSAFSVQQKLKCGKSLMEHISIYHSCCQPRVRLIHFFTLMCRALEFSILYAGR
jgi:hypothetical protein